MTMRFSGQGIELPEPLYAPPMDKGGVIIGTPLDNESAFGGEHIYVLVDQWEADPAKADMNAMQRALDKLKSWKTSHPGVVTNPRAITAINQLIPRIEAIITAKPPEAAEKIVGGRNAFEKWLVGEGFPVGKLEPNDPTDKDSCEKCWQLKRSFLLTKAVYEQVEVDGNFRSRKMATIGNKEFLVEGSNDKVQLQQLAAGMGATILGREGEIAREIAEKAVYDFALLDTVAGFYNEYFAANQSTTSIIDMFSIAKSGEKQLSFLNWAFSALDDMPPLLRNIKNVDEIDRSGHKTYLEPDPVPLSTKLLLATREIVVRGRRVKTDPTTGAKVLDKSNVSWEINVNLLDEKDVEGMQYAVIREGKTLKPKQLRANPSSGNTDENTNEGIYPFVAFSAAGQVERNFDKLALDLSVDPASGKVDLSGRFCALFAQSLLSAFNFEDAQQDCWPKKYPKEEKQGRPVGQNYFSRFLHAAEYMWKVFENPADRSGPVCKFLIGTVRKMLNGIFDNVSYKGQSLIERIIDPNTKAWVDKPGQQGVLDPEFLPPEINRNWMVAVQRTTQVFETFMKGFKEGAISKIAEFKLAEGKVTVNQAIIEALVTYYRLVTEYRTFTEAGPALAMNKTKMSELYPGSDVENDHLDGSFAKIELRDRNGRVIGKPMYSRFFSFYEANIQELAAWLQHPDSEDKLGIEIFKGGGWEQEKDPSRPTITRKNLAGKERNLAYLILDVDSTDPRDDIRIKFIEEKNTIKHLMTRYLLSHFLYIIVRQTIEAHILDKEDYMGILSFFSASYKHSYENGGERGPWLKMVNQIGKISGLDVLKTERIDITGPNMLTPRQAYQMLHSWGVDVKFEEVVKRFDSFAADISKLIKV